MKRADALLIYESLPDAQKVNILYDALDYMEQYNGRSKADCIILALPWSDEVEDEE